MMKQRKRSWWLVTFIAVALAGILPARGHAAQDDPGNSYSYKIFWNPAEPWLGVTLSDVDAAQVTKLKLPGDYGAIVQSVEPNSPAAKAGLQKDDVILEFAGERVRSAAEMGRLVRETPVGHTVRMKVSRSGATKTLEVTTVNHRVNTFLTIPSIRPFLSPRYKAEPLPNPMGPGMKRFFKGGPLPPASPYNNPFWGSGRVLGISGDDLTPQLASYFGVKDGKGVLVREVVQGSAADKAGLKAGDVIVKVGSEPVGTVGELREALQSQPGVEPKVALTIVRDRQERTLSVVLKPRQPQQIRSAEDWKQLGLSPEESKRLAAAAQQLALQSRAMAKQIAAEYQSKSARYQEDMQKMQEQLQQQLAPLKENLQRELEQEKRQLEKLKRSEDVV